MKTRLIDITPDKSLLPKMGFAGYSIPQAIAELVDNSIDAMLEGQKLKIAIHIEKDSIIIADNASGMDEKHITKALVLAHSEKKGKLGEFGLGMKVACLNLGDQFSVTTKPFNEEREFTIDYDSTDWANNPKDWEIPLKETETGNGDHYTVVKISKLRKFHPNLANYIRSDLQRRFAPYINNHDVEIIVNKKKCIPEKVELIDDQKTNFEIELKSGNIVRGWYGLLKQGSQKGWYGFSTFRRGRMITAFDKIGIGEHPTIARIVGEIHMDHVPVTTTKREFEKESPEYREVEEALKKEFREIVKLARQKAGEEKVTKDIIEEINIWKENISEAVNSKEFHTYTSKFEGLKIRRDEKSQDIEQIDVEQRNEKEDTSTTPEEKPKSEKDRTPTETHKKKRHVVRIKGKNVEFEHQFAHLGEEESWKKWKYDPGKVIEIFTNTDFPAFHATKDRVFYAVIHIAESISELLVHQAEEDPSNIDEIKELILRISSKIKYELN
ncbi:MAG TPA: ATP-binding protein [Verrucomicrobiae bacterium]|nr:ATP-binding protein [Verrucomicrobiae bacterium]